MLRYVLLISLTLLACGRPEDPLIGTLPCEDRCAGGCCAGDPANPMTECVLADYQDDHDCGSRAARCASCDPYPSSIDGHTIYLSCRWANDWERLCGLR